ncbi:LAME_0E13454g1_1 [Lachancea meyersii CBS 8951]|uniref:LAME_0E13454g1_1 n=1 Tax=Lachancea meyersii CBS 8951 TaxID=1266667 RepID=A0A1G4JM46_9SACH|nr:LAME_0E13454g1_1 [Lachancea meyersii CBS 8951]
MNESLVGFLKYIKNTYLREETYKSSHLSIVCGNESADLDSVVSAITYAYFSYIKNPSKPLVPVLNILRADLELRRDVVWILKQRNIPHSLLYFHEDLQDLRKSFKGPIEAVLVDHNDPQSVMKNLVDSVVGVIDHHEDLGLHKDIISRHNPRIITPSGSCSSLVFNYWHKTLDSSERAKMSPDALSLCLGALLIDTSKMSHKVEHPDQKAHAAYKQSLPNLNFDEFFSQLRQAKDDIVGLSLRDILRKDYKEFEFSKKQGLLKCGFASVVKPLEWIYAQFPDQEFVDSCENFGSERSLDILVVLTSWTDSKGQFERQVASYAKEKPNIEYSRLIAQQIAAPLKLQPLEVLNPPSENCAFFSQLDTSASRKQVVPYVHDACENL